MKTRIQRSAEADLRRIREWLVREGELEVEGNFLCNWSWIEESHRKGELLICQDHHGAPAGYLAGRLDVSTILQVRSDLRGRGIGRELVQNCITRIRKSIRPDGMLLIQCAPQKSIGFWEKMGFTVLPGEPHVSDVYAFREITKKHRLPVGRQTTVAVHSYPEEKKWEPGVAPVTSRFQDARVDAEGVVHLAERVYIFTGLPIFRRGDAVVEIRIDCAISSIGPG